MQALHWAVYVLIVTTFLLWCSSALCLRVLVFAFVAIRAISTQEICADFLPLLHHRPAGCLPAHYKVLWVGSESLTAGSAPNVERCRALHLCQRWVELFEPNGQALGNWV